jgi:hypothetical protein
VGGWLTPRPGRFTPGKETLDTLYSRSGGLQGRSGWVGKIFPQPGFFFCSLSTLYLLLCPVCPDCGTHNTNIHVLGGIRTRNPSKQAPADPHLRPLGHWDRLIRSQDRSACSESLYRLSYRGPCQSSVILLCRA